MTSGRLEVPRTPGSSIPIFNTAQIPSELALPIRNLEFPTICSIASIRITAAIYSETSDRSPLAQATTPLLSIRSTSPLGPTLPDSSELTTSNLDGTTRTQRWTAQNPTTFLRNFSPPSPISHSLALLIPD